jgi:hypothetical protein
MGQAGNSPVYTIQNHGNKDGDGGGFKVHLNGGDNGVEAGEQSRRGEHIGQQINTAVAPGVRRFGFQGLIIP